MKKIRLLLFVDRLLHGGIQTFICEYYTRFNFSNYEITLLTLDDGNCYPLENEIEKHGIKVVKLKDAWIKGIFSYLKYRRIIKSFFKKHMNRYDIFHMHSSSKNYFLLKCAKKAHIPIRITHSHNIGFQTKSKIKKYIGNIFKKGVIKYSTNYFSCSAAASEWLFGKENVDNTLIVKNAFDLSKFEFDEKLRDKIRNHYNISQNAFVIGCVGRFEQQKNHKFLLKIFSEILKEKPYSILMLVGDGQEKLNLMEQAKLENILDKIIFVGYQREVFNYYNAFDVFVSPSLYEGLGITIVEAQCNGLPCFVSDKVVPSEAILTSMIFPIGLDKNENHWSRIILEKSHNRKNEITLIKENGYDILDAVNRLDYIYRKLVNKEGEKYE